MASAAQLSAEARELLLALALTSTQPARTLIGLGGARPGSSEPTGAGTHPAEAWAARLERLAERASRPCAAYTSHTPSKPEQLEAFVAALRTEVDEPRRRTLPATAPRLADLGELVLRAEGFSPAEVSVALRCTPTAVRRARVVAGRHPETGRRVELNGNGADRIAWGMELCRVGGLSVRQAAAAAGLAKSKLGDRLAAA